MPPRRAAPTRRRDRSLEERLRRQREIAAYPTATAEELPEVLRFCRAEELPVVLGHSQGALDAWNIPYHGDAVCGGRQYFVENCRLLLYLGLTLKEGKPLATPRHPLARQILRHLLFAEADAGSDDELHAPRGTAAH